MARGKKINPQKLKTEVKEMIDYAAILKENSNGVLTTQDDRKLKPRVFQYLWPERNNVYFCTSNENPFLSK